MCYIVLAVNKADSKSIELVLGEAIIETKKELTQYFITDDPKSNILKKNYVNKVFFEIIFKRR